MTKKELISCLEEQLTIKQDELENIYNDLINEYETQNYINDILLKARKDSSYLAKYIINLKDNEEKKFDKLVEKFLDEDEIISLYQDSRNLYYMKKNKFDVLGVPQYEEAKKTLTKFFKKLNEFNLQRNFKYINLQQLSEINTYLKRVKEVKSYFNNGLLIKEIIDIKELEYIIKKSKIDESLKTEIIYAIFDENNKFYKKGEKLNAIETI